MKFKEKLLIYQILKKSNLYFYRAIRKYGINNFEYSILFKITENNKYNVDFIIKEREIELIELLQTNNMNFGYNMTAGGDGILGYIMPNEIKLKLSLIGKERHKTFKGTMFGKHHSDETKQFFSQKYKGIGNPNYNNKMSDISKKRISEANKGRKWHENAIKKRSETNKKPIYQYDLNGNFIREWDSAKTAAFEISGINTGSPITSVCKGKLKTYHKYVWKYKERISI